MFTDNDIKFFVEENAEKLIDIMMNTSGGNTQFMMENIVENPIQSTSCSKATTKSALSFAVKLEILIFVSGKLRPFLENNNPPATTLVFRK